MTDPLSEWLDTMSAKARAATPGPWFAISDLPSYTVGNRNKDIIATRNRLYRVPHEGRANFGCSERDAAYLAALPPETVQAMLDCVRALETISRWEFAADGRKFDGNHKNVIKEVTRIANDALAHLRRLAERSKE